MKKIFAPTDYSENSKAGIRFAIRLAEQASARLVFYHAFSRFIPTFMSAGVPVVPQKPDGEQETERLVKFIKSIYRPMKISMPANIEFLVKNSESAAESIAVAAKKSKADLIVMSTHGAGGVEKLIGTNTGQLITSSPVPVLVIPKNYRFKEIGEIAYASDFSKLKKELLKLIPFAKTFNARIEVLHFDYFKGFQILKTEKTFKTVSKSIPYKKISLKCVTASVNDSLIYHIEKYIYDEKKELLAMFTEQKRSFFEKLFIGSKTESLSFTIKIPMMSFKK